MKIRNIITATFVAVAALAATQPATAKKMSDLRIYINPGHGGYTGNDRPIRIHPFAQNDTLGYWESKSNLYKGLHMYHILDSLGAKPFLSRIKNTEEDDRSLSGIAAEANSLNCDLFFSIHSNAGENVNYPIMLYRENSIGTPRYPENVTLSKILFKNLISNKLPHWTRTKEYVEGDLTFYQNMWQGGLGVLRTLYVVGLLSEGGMHEHRPEAHRLMNDDYLWLEAWHFVRSIMEFSNTEDRFVTGNVAGIVYDDHNLREFIMPANFSKFGRDLLAPVNGAFVELLDKSGKTIQKRTTDDMYNGVFVFRNVIPGEYDVRVTDSRYYTSTTPVTVTANEVTYQDMPLSLKRENPLTVASYTPATSADESVSCASIVEISFTTDVDAESFEKAFSITPEVDGYFTYFDSYHRVTFTPKTSFEVNTTYTVKLSTEAKTPDPYFANPNLPEDLTFSFTTRGRNKLELIDQFPANNGEVHYAAPQVEFRFDNRLSADIFNNITLTDDKGSKISLNQRNLKSNSLSNNYGNLLITLPNLEPGKQYTFTVNGELRDRENLPMMENVVTTFTATDAAQADLDPETATVFDTFEDNAAITPNADLSTGISGVLGAMRSTSVKLFDKASGRVTYNFADTHGGQAVWNYSGPSAQFYPNDKMGLYINGDFNNHELWLGFSAGTNIKYKKVDDLNFLGWRYREIELDNLEEDFAPFMLSEIKLVQAPGPITQKGQVAFDNFTVIKKNAAVTEIKADADNCFKTFVDQGYIYLMGAAPNAAVNIFSASGALVSTVVTNAEGTATIVATHLPHGVYILTSGPHATRIVL